MSKVLEINDLLFHWGDEKKFYLDIKQLTIENKKKTILFGESGTGKSTLLNLIGGILNPLFGTLKIKGTIINSLSQKEKDAFRANNIGVIFQQFNILDYISPLSNILLPCYFTGFKKENKKYFYERAHELAYKLGLNKSTLLQKNSRQLSIGQKQRIAILRAVINRPFLILADEPTSALDNTNKKKFLDLLMNICENENITILMVTHDKSIKKYFDTYINIENIISNYEAIN